MNPVIEKTVTPIQRGIKLVGVGKKGSRSLPLELAEEILGDLKANKVSSVTKGAFFAGLVLKGITKEEMILEQTFEPGILTDPQKLTKVLAHDAPQDIQEICTQILAKKELDKQTAKRLGDFLFSNKPGDGVRGLVACALRVRYETPDEYDGLLESMGETLTDLFRRKVPSGDPIIQLSEPFDGVDQSYLITPLLANFIQAQGFRVISMVGRNSGPKQGINLLDLVKFMNLEIARSNEDLSDKKPLMGWYFDQRLLSQALDRWVDLRRQIIKRPFLATLEKFLNPTQAEIIVTSAFHPIYGDKMMTIAERAHFPGAIVVKNGIEGTIAFPLKRVAKILCSARKRDGTYLRQELTSDPVAYLGFEVPLEEKLANVSLQENAGLIQEYQDQGKTVNELFNHRVRVTCCGLKRALQWIRENLDK